jgi:hypothetical protein
MRPVVIITVARKARQTSYPWCFGKLITSARPNPDTSSEHLPSRLFFTTRDIMNQSSSFWLSIALLCII